MDAKHYVTLLRALRLRLRLGNPLCQLVIYIIFMHAFRVLSTNQRRKFRKARYLQDSMEDYTGHARHVEFNSPL